MFFAFSVEFSAIIARCGDVIRTSVNGQEDHPSCAAVHVVSIVGPTEAVSYSTLLQHAGRLNPSFDRGQREQLARMRELLQGLKVWNAELAQAVPWEAKGESYDPYGDYRGKSAGLLIPAEHLPRFADVEALQEALDAVDEKGGAWDYFQRAMVAARDILVDDKVMALLSSSALKRFLLDDPFDGDGPPEVVEDEDDVGEDDEPVNRVFLTYFPGESHAALRKGDIFAASGADIYVAHPLPRGDAKILHTHPESCSVLGKTMVDFVRRQVAGALKQGGAVAFHLSSGRVTPPRARRGPARASQ